MQKICKYCIAIPPYSYKQTALYASFQALLKTFFLTFSIPKKTYRNTKNIPSIYTYVMFKLYRTNRKKGFKEICLVSAKKVTKSKV